MPKKLTQSERETARKFKKILAEEKQGKLHYEQFNKLRDELLRELADPTKPFRLVRSGKKMGCFEDNYPPGVNKCFRSHGINRFEPKVIELPK